MHTAFGVGRGRWRAGLVVTLGALVSAATAVLPADAAPVDAERAIVASADTYVTSASPGSAHGSAKILYADADPVKISYLRFDVGDLDAAALESLQLELYQVGESRVGGRVLAVSSPWSESTMTWSNRVGTVGAPLASFGAVTAGSWYRVRLSGAAPVGGVLSLAIDSTSTDGSYWASRETGTAPRLIVAVADSTTTSTTTTSSTSPSTTSTSTSTTNTSTTTTSTTTTSTSTTSTSTTSTTTTTVPPAASCAPAQVAAATEGSSDPTRYGGNHRMARTAMGRLLAVHGRHGRGVQLAWRDPSGSWRRTTAGATTDGLLLDGAGSGDWGASIAVVRDAAGVEHAWAIWSGPGQDSSFPVWIRPLRDLDAAGGPTVGPLTTLSPAAVGTGRADLIVERGNPERVLLAWTRGTLNGMEVVVAGLVDVTADVPTIDGPHVVQAASATPRLSLVETPSGAALVLRSAAGRLRVLRHAASDSAATWTAGPEGVAASGSARVNAIALRSGDILATAERDTTRNVITVQRFDAAGVPREIELDAAGYLEPTIATDGTSAWLLAVRTSDGNVVSRRRDTTWSEDRVELDGTVGSNYQAPNPLRAVSGSLAFIVRGPSGGSSRNAVLACERSI